MPKSISDDDLCATCTHCQYASGELSNCVNHWPNRLTPDYIEDCIDYQASPTLETPNE